MKMKKVIAASMLTACMLSSSFAQQLNGWACAFPWATIPIDGKGPALTSPVPPAVLHSPTTFYWKLSPYPYDNVSAAVGTAGVSYHDLFCNKLTPGVPFTVALPSCKTV